jgi:hypothetical protein
MFSSENQWVYLIALLPVTTSQAGHGRAYGDKEPTVADLGSPVAKFRAILRQDKVRGI